MWISPPEKKKFTNGKSSATFMSKSSAMRIEELPKQLNHPRPGRHAPIIGLGNIFQFRGMKDPTTAQHVKNDQYLGDIGISKLSVFRP